MNNSVIISGDDLPMKSKGLPAWADGNAKGGHKLGTPQDTAQVNEMVK